MRVVVVIDGREVRQVFREVVVNVPDGTTEDEVNKLNVDDICSQIDDEEWKVNDSDGVDPGDISFVAEAEECEEADCHFVKTEDGQLVPLI